MQVINSYTAQATHCDTKSCMFPYLILRYCKININGTCTVHNSGQTVIVMHNILHNIIRKYGTFYIGSIAMVIFPYNLLAL